jgi:hypothetical protein
MIMAEELEALAAVELTLEDAERFLAPVLEKIGGRRTPPGTREQWQQMVRLQQWLVVGARSKRDAEVMRKMVTIMKRMSGQRRREFTERNIEVLLELLLQDEERASVERELELDNAMLRARYVREVPAYTAADIHELMPGARSRNPSEPASRWRREKKVFGVRAGRGRLFPRFQFADGRPRPVIGEIIQRLPDDMTSWQTAFWFWSGNGWLDGRSPADALGDPDSVLEAASRLGEPAVG